METKNFRIFLFVGHGYTKIIVFIIIPGNLEIFFLYFVKDLRYKTIFIRLGFKDTTTSIVALEFLKVVILA